jgi:RNA recognition motif-containing protein
MAKKLFVGNLPFTMTDDQLTQIFSAYGKVVSANVVFDKFSQRSKGFAFVEFETEEEAKAAMQALDGSDQQGRNIAVKEALPRPERPQNPASE